jgi:hypothetical protein
MIKPTDYLLVCAHSDEDIFSLQASLSHFNFCDFAIYDNGGAVLVDFVC